MVDIMWLTSASSSSMSNLLALHGVETTIELSALSSEETMIVVWFVAGKRRLQCVC